MAHFVIASEAKQFTFAMQIKNELVRRGAFHRARIRAARWLLAMAANMQRFRLFEPNSEGAAR